MMKGPAAASNAGADRFTWNRRRRFGRPAQRQIGHPDDDADQQKQDVNFHCPSTQTDTHTDIAASKRPWG